MKKLVTYFSATGVTAKVANLLAEAIGADVFEIRPAEPYTEADLNWWEETSRSTKEMQDPGCRPRIAGVRDNIREYDVIFVGFPIWWNVAPRIINTFLESCDLEGRTVIPFATSGKSGAERVNASIQDSCAAADLKQARRLSADSTFSELSAWAESVL